MKELLILTHRIPYPPNKGDKIRSYNLVSYLAQYYKIHLGAFVDDAADFQYENKIAEICESYHLVALPRGASKLRSLTAFLSSQPLTNAYYFSRDMKAWVDSTLADREISTCLVYCSGMAQYVSGERYKSLKRYIDFVDVDSDKWKQYQYHSDWLMRRIYAYEAAALFAWEKLVAEEFCRSFFVSAQEADLFKKLAPELAHKVAHYDNGVDLEYFSPDHQMDSPYNPSDKVIVFTGVMDYKVNVEAVCWFAKEIFPQVVEKVPESKFYIVGSNPVRSVSELASDPRIEVTGRVDDVRPYMGHASIAVAPMKIARGVQNKLLESLAMGLPIITTHRGACGLKILNLKELYVLEHVEEWVSTLVRILLMGIKLDAGSLRERRDLLRHSYCWESSLGVLRESLEGQGDG